MGRPANTSAAETRTRILESAFLLFSERGSASTSIRDVASAANVTSAMLGHYFGNKEMLYDACVEETFRELRMASGHLEHLLGLQRVDLAEVLPQGVRAMFQWACAHRPAVRLLVRAAMTTGEVHPYGMNLLMDAMKTVAEGLGKRLDRKPKELRLPLQSLVFLVARYAAQAENELMLVVGTKNKTEALAKVEDHLVHVALELFAIPQEKKMKRSAR
jgi:AcrR family transcriptional regulator